MARKRKRKRATRAATRRCLHKRVHGVIWNPTDGGRMILVSWCTTCGAIMRAFGIPDGDGGFVYKGFGGPADPQWEHPHGVNGTVRDKHGLTRDERAATERMA